MPPVRFWIEVDRLAELVTAAANVTAPVPAPLSAKAPPPAPEIVTVDAAGAATEPTISVFTPVPLMPTPVGLLTVRPSTVLPSASVTALPEPLVMSGFEVAVTRVLPFTTRFTPWPMSFCPALSTIPLARFVVEPLPR